jgi:hypothetical protein
MTENEKALLTVLQKIRQATFGRNNPRPLHYCCTEDFVVRHGQFYQWRPLPDDVHVGAPRCCYGNALALCVMDSDRFRYVEGFAMSSVAIGLPVHHAWVIDPEGYVVDNTWPHGVAYLGVEFSYERAADCIWNGDATVIDDWNRDWPLLHSEWKGEIHGPWPYVECLDDIRNALKARRRRRAKHPKL